MKVLLIYRHHPRCIPHYHRRALQQLGHEVTTIGPWDAAEPFGIPGCEADVDLGRWRLPPHTPISMNRWPDFIALAVANR